MNRSVIPCAIAVALAGAVVTAPAATAAEPAAARPTTQKVSRVDIDGDGRGDLTTLTLVTARRDYYGLRLTVRTATGKVASMTFHAANYDTFDMACVWPITSGFDGVRGNEIALNPYGCVGDGQYLRVYTWRGGKLTLLAAPGERPGTPWWVNSVRGIYGYTFSMSGSTRYVVRHHVSPSASGRTYSGTNTMYRWAPKGWVKVKTTKAGPIARNAASKLGDFRGLILR